MIISNNMHNIDVGKTALGTNINIDNINQLQKVIETYVDLGGITLDTAHSYLGGMSELIIGKCIRRLHLQKKLIISTKVGKVDEHKSISLKKEDIRRELEQSLKILKLDYVDILWLHRDDVMIPVDYIIEYLNDFIDEGLIKIFGASNWSYERIKKANTYAEKSGFNGFSASQIQWSLAVPNFDYYKDNQMVSLQDEYKEYVDSQFPVFAYSPQAKGLFHYMLNNKEKTVRHKSFENRMNNVLFDKICRIIETDKVSISEILLSFVLDGKINAIPIIGANSSENVCDSIKNLEYHLQKDVYLELLEKRLCNENKW